jgi:nucleoside phosphorylase
MEASAFLYVCKHTGVISLGVVKGVSDLGDINKVVSNEDDYNSAIINTANAVRLWIGAMPDTITPLPRGLTPQNFQ